MKDDRAQISAVLFRSDAARLRFRPSDGLEVVAFGHVRLYDARGQLQLYVQSLEPRGLGALRQQLEQLRARLEREGLLDPARKRPLPFLPRCIGIVTALRGAAIRDMLRMLGDRFPNLRIVVRPVRVQGIGAEQEIADGIRDLQGVGEIDVVIVGRGGGSIEDLWAFNDEGVARAIVACRVPVVSAVGHEIDVTIADLVADARAATPTAAAELVVPRRRDLEQMLDDRRRALAAALRRTMAASRRRVQALRARLRDPRRDLVLGRSRLADGERRLHRAFVRVTAAERDRIGALTERLRQASPIRVANERRSWVRQMSGRLETSVRHRLDIARARVGGVSAGLSGLSPLAVLARGYCVVWKTDGTRALRSAGEASIGEELDVRLHRGRLRAMVRAVELDDGEEPGS
jgi:exodeoxyribonuclease VII large subunit